MSPLRLSDADGASLRAVLLVQRWSRGLARVTDEWLGDAGTDTTDVQILLAVLSVDGVGPSGVVAAIGMPRSTVARGVARLLRRGFLERRTSPVDRRRATLHVTAEGRSGIARLEQALADHLRDEEPTLKEVVLLLGHDPEPPRVGTRPAGVLEVVGALEAWRAEYLRDLRPRLRALDTLGGAEHHALTMLAQRWARPTEIAEELALSPAGTTSLLERLEAAGLVVREPGGLAGDRRAVLVHLTPRGRREARTMLTTFQQHAEALLPVLRSALALR
jgi:DNA-binding MarR family transcriptional regulator